MDPEINPNEPVYSLNVLEFLRVAHEYCLFIEKTDDNDGHRLMEFFQKISPLLYLKGSLLPVIEPEYPEANERMVTEEEWESVFNDLRNKFGKDDEFYSVDPALAAPGETVKSSMAENLTDIYQDLKDFILLYQKRSRAAKENAVCNARSWFLVRWGPALLRSLKNIHGILAENDTTADEPYDLI